MTTTKPMTNDTFRISGVLAGLKKVGGQSYRVSIHSADLPRMTYTTDAHTVQVNKISPDHLRKWVRLTIGDGWRVLGYEALSNTMKG